MIGLLIFALLISSTAIVYNLYSLCVKENKEEYFFWILAHSAVLSFNIVNLINVIKSWNS